MDNKTYVVIQARMGSTRRPGKINYLFDGEPMLGYQIKRLKSFGIDNIIVVTSTEKQDDITEKIVLNNSIKCFRGSENDVMNRFYECALKYNIGTIIRVGGDDPLIDPDGIKTLYNEYKKNANCDLIYTSHENGWIYGTAAELFTFESLKKANSLSVDKFEREHVIPYYKNNENTNKMKLNASTEIKRKDIYLSVDYQEDLDLIEQILRYFTNKNKRYSFSQEELIKLYDSGELSINNKHLHSGF